MNIWRLHLGSAALESTVFYFVLKMKLEWSAKSTFMSPTEHFNQKWIVQFISELKSQPYVDALEAEGVLG